MCLPLFPETNSSQPTTQQALLIFPVVNKRSLDWFKDVSGHTLLVGGIPIPLKHIKATWDDCILPTEWKNGIHVPNHQPVYIVYIFDEKYHAFLQMFSSPLVIRALEARQFCSMLQFADCQLEAGNPP